MEMFSDGLWEKETNNIEVKEFMLDIVDTTSRQRDREREGIEWVL